MILSGCAVTAADDNSTGRSRVALRSDLLLARALHSNVSSEVVEATNILALRLDEDGRHEEAQSLYRQAIDSLEADRDSQVIAQKLKANLARSYLKSKNYDEAELIYRGLIEIDKIQYGPASFEVAVSSQGLAEVMVAKGDYREATTHLKRSWDIIEREDTFDPRLEASILGTTARVAQLNGQLNEAESILRIQIERKIQYAGSGSIEVSEALNNLGNVLDDNGKFDEAISSYLRSIEIMANWGEKDSYAITVLKGNLAAALFHTGDYAGALSAIREANHPRRLREDFSPIREKLAVEILWAFAGADPSDRGRLLEEAFSSTQWALGKNTERTMLQFAARMAGGEGDLAELVRARDTALALYSDLDREAVAAYGDASSPNIREQIEKDKERTASEFARYDNLVKERFPAYQELTRPEPLYINEVNGLLGNHEALLTYLVTEDGVFLFVITDRTAAWRRLDVRPDDLVQRVRKLRTSLDPGQGGGVGVPFPIVEARALRKLLLPEEKILLGDVTSLLIVPDGPLESLPFSLLAGDGSDGTDLWLMQRYATTTLPGVSSLKALRRLSGASQASHIFVGIGDPSLGDSGRARGISLAGLVDRRGLGDPAKLRALPSLPQTRPELEHLATTLGADRTRLLLGDQATETRVKAGALSDSKLVAFATHAALAGQIEGIAQPALVLTPPVKATDLDDGLLTASEAAELNFDSDLVILSACNTAAPDGTPGAEGLSGLARAFIYAGTRAMLVSHWEVYDDAAQRITTGVLSAIKDAPEIGLAEALRRSEQELVALGYSHPSYWAPFVLVGEGRSGWSLMPDTTGRRGISTTLTGVK